MPCEPESFGNSGNGAARGKARAKPKATAKGKARAVSNAQAQASNFGADMVEVPVDERPKDKDPKTQRTKDKELEKLDLQRKLVVSTNKWRTRLEELNQEVTLSLEESSNFVECKNLCNILKLRLERMYALLPTCQECRFPDRTAASEVSKDSRDKLSPLTQSKVRALDDPSKASIADYEKSMSSAEQAVSKALTLLNKTYTDMQVLAEKEKSKEKRMEQIRAKRAEAALKAIKDAQAAGHAEAEKELGKDNESGEEGSTEKGGDQERGSDSDAETSKNSDGRQQRRR